MERLPPKVQERLDQLAAQFRAALPGIIEEIAEVRRRSEDGDLDALRELRMRVHRVAGSAATFGFERLTETARAAERSIEGDLASDEQLLSAESASILDCLRADPGPEADHMTLPMREPAGAHATDDGPPATGTPDQKRRSVILAGPVPGLLRGFGEQLAVFGLTLLEVDETSEIEALLGEPGRDGEPPGYDYTVLLSTVQFLSGRVSRLKDLTRLRSVYPGRFLTILVGDEDDFDTRLKSVRFGADAFLAKPFDITQLVDHLETLMGNHQAAPYHVMIVDDDPEQVSSTALVLQQAGMITTVVTDPRNIFRVLVEYKPELILMDMYMPDCTGSELAAIIRQNDSFVGVPIVFLSVETDSDKQLAAIRSGADDFLVKPINPEHLVTSVRIRAARTRAMRFYMERDSLTGLLNHTKLKQRLADDLSRARRIGTDMVFAMIDIDHFKSVNDTYGHLTGDRVLKGLARLLEERLRRTDVVGRYGGEEFGVILFNIDAENAMRILDDLRESFGRLIQTNGELEFTVTFSCGIADFPEFESDAEIGEAADLALYRAKQSGRNRVVRATRELLTQE
jgi:diguanylate cyclase (GGDEF)-like protein